MIDAKEVLRRWAARQRARQMAREGVVSRRTEAARSLWRGPSDELTDPRVGALLNAMQASPLPAVSDPRQLLEARPILGAYGATLALCES